VSKKIDTIAVVGAGTMGRGIAYVSALAGYTTFIFDPDPTALAAAGDVVFALLDKGLARGKVEPDAAEAAKRTLRLAETLEDAVSSADLVIEAVPESMQAKRSVFERVDVATPDHAILASNTSGLSITELASSTSRRERFAGMHFFNPVHRMRLIELVRGEHTSSATLALLAEVGRRMGKEIVTVTESPGFVTSRINALIGNEAFRMLEDGVASARDIDKALKLGLNHPMGPFEMVDLVGLDVRLSILEYLHRTLGDLYRPSSLLVRYVEEGRLGRKVGHGVYRYDEDGSRLD
jgi:3-hydroxybutyryl-CoA dehydrogenase